MGDLAEKFRRYGEWVTDKSPLYATLAGAVADDRQLRTIASETLQGQPEPQLLLAAVHWLLLTNRSHPLAEFYPSCGGEGSEDDPVPAFRDFCFTHDTQLRAIVASRRCQTNEVGRAAVLLPAFEYVTRHAKTRSLALIELGASAGLNLNWDRYRYEIGSMAPIGPADSPVTIEAEVWGQNEPPLPSEFPPVAFRQGIDLNPLDVADEADARWLRALIPPEQTTRHDRLAAAIDVAGEHPPDLVEGDVLDQLPQQLGATPDDATLVVYSTHLLYQLSEDTVDSVRSLLAGYSTDQPVYWLTLAPTQELGTPVYRLVTFVEGVATEQTLIEFESYGAWVRWLAPEGSPTSSG